MALFTTDAVKLQVQNLIIAHNYKAEFILNNPSTLTAYLDTYEINFTASGSKQNIFILLTKEVDIPTVVIEVIITDLTDNNKGSSSMFIQCPDYTGCNDNSYFLPLMLDFVP